MFTLIILATYGQHVFHFAAEVKWCHIEWQFGAKNTKVLNYLLRLLVVVAYIDITSIEGGRRGGRHTLDVVGLSGAVIVSCRMEDISIVLHKRRLHPGGHDIGKIGVFCDTSNHITGQCLFAAGGDNMESNFICGGNFSERQFLAGVVDGAGGDVTTLLVDGRITAAVEEVIFCSRFCRISCLHQGVTAVLVGIVVMTEYNIAVATSFCFWCTVP